MSFPAFQQNLHALKKHKEISFDTCIVRTLKGFEVQKIVYWFDSSGLQISPICHVEKKME